MLHSQCMWHYVTPHVLFRSEPTLRCHAASVYDATIELACNGLLRTTEASSGVSGITHTVSVVSPCCAQCQEAIMAHGIYNVFTKL